VHDASDSQDTHPQQPQDTAVQKDDIINPLPEAPTAAAVLQKQQLQLTLTSSLQWLQCMLSSGMPGT